MGEILENSEVEGFEEVLSALRDLSVAAGKDPKEILKYLAEHPDFFERSQLVPANSPREIAIALFSLASSGAPQVRNRDRLKMAA